MNDVRKRKWRRIYLAAVLLLLVSISAGCQGTEKESDNLLLYLSFDEKTGTEIADSAGKVQDAEVHYLYNHAAYMEDREPEWRENGVNGGSLLFDGNSTYIEYDPEEICVSGETFSISVWVAPRAFEWDDPNAAENGTEHLTSIVSQYDKKKCQGILLGYQRFGRLSFQVGTGDEWITLWGDEEKLQKYQWNFVTATFDGANGEMKLYLNGNQVASKDIQPGAQISPAERKKFLVGKNSDAEQIAAGTYNMFAGLMDELKVSGDVMAEEEVTLQEAPEIALEDIWLENILTQNIYKTQYHGGPYQHWMNEPHAPFYYNGMYHLFYQSNMVGTYWRNICWGHLVSEDMVHWTPMKEAITPCENSVVPDGVWSGGAAMDVNGVPLLFFTAGNDSYAKDGLISNQNIGVAYPKDLTDPYLTEWVICDELAIQQVEGQGRAGEFRDSHIWKEGDIWCMLVCTGSMEQEGGSAVLYESETLEVKEDGTIDMDWKYMGPVYEMENQPMTYGTSWELPIILPLTNEAGTATKYIFMISPAPAGLADNKVYYFLGDFDVATGKFTPDERFDNHPALLDYGSNVFTGPSVLVDPQSGDVCVFSIMQDQRTGAEEGAAGWAHCVGLTRKIWLNDEGSDVKMSPIDALHTLEGSVLADEENLAIEQANDILDGVKGDLLYIKAVLTPEDAQEFGIQLKTDENGDTTSYTYRIEDTTISGDTRNKGSAASTSHVLGTLSLQDGKLSMEIYIDRSLVEAFFNEEKSISIRSYSAYDSQGIQLFADGNVTVDSLYIATMQSIYDEE
ncbi:MAG: GH32 C-terminal domain-containing protein [Muribaculaceae bacterium]|nr:GH32 C-terminal domain-containing protein [Muribaculaceae bacterium]